MVKVKFAGSAGEIFLSNVKSKLPDDLEYHESTSEFGITREIRQKGFVLNFWRPSVSIDIYARKFYAYHHRDLPLARRLAGIFPEVSVETYNLAIAGEI